MWLLLCPLVGAQSLNAQQKQRGLPQSCLNIHVSCPLKENVINLEGGWLKINLKCIYLFKSWLICLLFCNETSNSPFSDSALAPASPHFNKEQAQTEQKWCTEGSVPDYFLDGIFILPGFPALPVPGFAGSSMELLHAGIKLVPVFFSDLPDKHWEVFTKRSKCSRMGKMRSVKQINVFFFLTEVPLTFLDGMYVNASK